MSEDDVAECDKDSLEMPQEMDHNKEMGPVDRSDCRDVKTGRFTKGWKGGGRPVGSKDRFSKRVLDTLEACWEANADAMLEQLAAEKPEVIMGMVAKLMPANLITEDITGITDDSSKNHDVTIKVVTQQTHDVLPPREVDGELMLHDDTTH